MDAPAVALSAVFGLLVGWFVVVPVVERIPEPAPLPRRAQIVVVIVNAALWAADANKFPRWWIVVPYFVMFSAFLAVSVVDLRLFRIPDRILFPAVAVTVPMMIVSTIVVQHGRGSVVEILEHAAAGMFTYFAILFLFHIMSPRGMGFGDVKLASLMGLGLGWLAPSIFNAIYFVLIALLVGCLFGIAFGLAMRLIKGRGGAFPFGPALVLAAVYVMLTFDRYVTNL